MPAQPKHPDDNRSPASNRSGAPRPGHGRRTWSGLVAGAGALLLAACSAAPVVSAAPVAERTDAPSVVPAASATRSADRVATGPATFWATGPVKAMPSSAATAIDRPTAAPRAKAAGVSTSAAHRYGWTKVVASDDFNGTRPSKAWRVYKSRGHAGKGVRSRGQVTVRNGVLRIVGTKDGTTGGMSWKHARTYGRWEVRARFAPGCGCYHPVLILRPTEVPWPAGGEVDYVEVTKDPQRRLAKFFLHYSAQNQQLRKTKSVDMTTWHNYAVEWTPGHMTGYIDGVPWFRTTRKDVLPPGPMHQTIQLDWFPGDGAGGTGLMEVDWARMYAL